MQEMGEGQVEGALDTLKGTPQGRVQGLPDASLPTTVSESCSLVTPGSVPTEKTSDG